MWFRKKPVVIEAVQFNGRNPAQIMGFTKSTATLDEDGLIRIHTLEGWMIASVGDWIIKGVKGEFYPVKPDIFEATYEPVGEAKP